MGKRQKVWAQQSRARLMTALGGCCSRCRRVVNLQFDCIVPCGDEHHRLDTARRCTFYWRQYRQGNLQILCETCHSVKTAHEDQRATDQLPRGAVDVWSNGADANVPF